MTRIMSASLLPECRFGATRMASRGGEQGAGLVLAFALFGRRVAVGDDAGAGLDMHHAVLEHGGAQHDAAIDRAIGREIADAAGIGAARFGFEFGDDPQARTLGAPLTVPAGKPASRASTESARLVSSWPTTLRRCASRG
jgi:hypothetical protein